MTNNEGSEIEEVQIQQIGHRDTRSSSRCVNVAGNVGSK